MKSILEAVERFLSSLMATMMTLGVFLTLNFIFNLIAEELVTTELQIFLAIASIALTFVSQKILECVEEELFYITVEEYNQKPDEDANELYEHLMKGIK